MVHDQFTFTCLTSKTFLTNTHRPKYKTALFALRGHRVHQKKAARANANAIEHFPPSSAAEEKKKKHERSPLKAASPRRARQRNRNIDDGCSGLADASAREEVRGGGTPRRKRESCARSRVLPSERTSSIPGPPTIPSYSLHPPRTPPLCPDAVLPPLPSLRLRGRGREGRGEDLREGIYGARQGFLVAPL